MQPRDRSYDSPERFLSELRSLRDWAGLRHGELAARAHYPSDVLRAAEAGPSLPDLPILSAYVRGCGGEVTEWEDRWRALSGTGGPASLPMRHIGDSAAAAAGARAGAAVAPPDEHDPAHIMAVLARASDTTDAPASAVTATPPPAAPTPTLPLAGNGADTAPPPPPPPSETYVNGYRSPLSSMYSEPTTPTGPATDSFGTVGSMPATPTVSSSAGSSPPNSSLTGPGPATAPIMPPARGARPARRTNLLPIVLVGVIVVLLLIIVMLA